MGTSTSKSTVTRYSSLSVEMQNGGVCVTVPALTLTEADVQQLIAAAYIHPTITGKTLQSTIDDLLTDLEFAVGELQSVMNDVGIAQINQAEIMTLKTRVDAIEASLDGWTPPMLIESRVDTIEDRLAAANIP